jgi:hypothetical protein|tara:strand:- start:2502 stop:2834 length:333 start_codon:yes stop_codon:yes gene_type:complete
MKIKTIKVNIDSTYKYIQLWNGIFNLTDKELTILSSFIDVNDITEEVNLCSVKNKKAVSQMIGLKDYNTLNNYIKRFKDKGVILKNDNTYKINPFLYPDADKVEISIERK